MECTLDGANTRLEISKTLGLFSLCYRDIKNLFFSTLATLTLELCALTLTAWDQHHSGAQATQLEFEDRRVGQGHSWFFYLTILFFIRIWMLRRYIFKNHNSIVESRACWIGYREPVPIRDWKSNHLEIWIGKTLTSVGFISRRFWRE